MEAFVSTDPFSVTSPLPAQLLAKAGIELRKNPFGHKMNTAELAQVIGNADALIAGTEKIDESVFKNAPNLKLIARVGIGLDGVDFELCKRYGIRVTYTPEAPTIAVAELTVGLMIDLMRRISYTDLRMRQQIWQRYMGGLLRGRTIGLFGMGRIGKSVAHLLAPFGVKILVNELKADVAFARMHGIELVDKQTLLTQSDIVSLHIPLNERNTGFLTLEDFRMMKRDAIFVNTARGGIAVEDDLYQALKEGLIAGAAVDVFENEPYKGPLARLDNCLLTSHMGASTVESRTMMETEAVEEVIRFATGKALKYEVFGNE